MPDPGAGHPERRRQGGGINASEASSAPVTIRPAWAHPALWIAAAWMAGLVAGWCFGWPREVVAVGLLGAFGAQGLQLFRHHRLPHVHPPPGGLFLLLAVGVLGLWRGMMLVEENHRALDVARWAQSQWIVTVEGILAAPPERHPGGIVFRVRGGSRIACGDEGAGPMPLEVTVHCRDGGVDGGTNDGAGVSWRSAVRGDCIQATGFFRAVPGTQNPVPLSPLSRQWAQGEGGRLRVAGAGDIEIKPPENGRGIIPLALGAAHRLRGAAREQLLERGGETVGPALVAMVLGETRDLSPSDYQRFQRSGLLHLFSVSGLHAGIIAAALYGIFTLLRLPSRPQSLLVVLGVLAYAALTGFRLPVVRTVLMVGALGMQSWLRRPTDLLSRLALAALVICVLWPRSLFQAGFQLSFLAVFTLVVFSPLVAEVVRLRGVDEKDAGSRYNFPRSTTQFLLRALLHFTLLQLALAPLLIVYFQQVSLVAPLANLVGVPLAMIALIAGAVMAGPGFLIPGLNALVAPIAQVMTHALFFVIDLLAAPDFAAIIARPFPPLMLLVYYMLLFGGVFLRFGRGPGHEARRRAAAALHLLGLVALLAWLPWLRMEPRDRLRVTFIDVGQGDAILLEPPGGAALLVDAGPAFPPNAARYTLEPVLRTRGIGRIDLLLATHADADHIGGFADLLESFHVVSVAGWKPALDTPPLDRIRSEQRRCPRAIPRPLHAGQVLRVGPPDFFIEVLHPPEVGEAGNGIGSSEGGGGGDRNTSSVVLRVRWREFSLLLTGDADREAETGMIRRYGPDGLRATVLKAGHHGSDSSTGEAFLEAVSPNGIVFSCGLGNRYGHPSTRVLTRCAQSTALWLHRTDLDGALVLETDGHRMWLTAWNDVPIQ